MDVALGLFFNKYILREHSYVVVSIRGFNSFIGMHLLFLKKMHSRITQRTMLLFELKKVMLCLLVAKRKKKAK